MSPNQALQRTPGFGIQLPGAALVRPARSRAVRPAMKPRPHRCAKRCGRAGPESPGLRSSGVATRLP